MKRALQGVLCLIMLIYAPVASATSPADRASVEAFKRAFSEAAATNDVATIAPYLAPDWRVIEVQGQTITRKDFLAVLQSGALRYDLLEGRDLDIRVYGDTAVVTGHAISKGSFDGKPFSSDEISSEVLIREQGKWRFVLTHLTNYKK